MKEYAFEARIIKNEKVDSGYIEFPYDVYHEFGKKGQVKVKAFFDGYEYRGSLVKMGTPCHIIGLNKKVREAINKQPGNSVHVVIIEDTEERTVNIPDDLNSVLMGNAEVNAVFSKLSFSHKREYVEWIISAKKQETRTARIVKFAEMILSGKKNPGEK